MKKIAVLLFILGMICLLFAFVEQNSVFTDTKASWEIVYITRTGKKYHSTKHCPGLSNAISVFPTTQIHAELLNLRPCSKCY